MYNVICHTNLDEYKNQIWPDKLPIVPRKGDRVQAQSRKELYVVGITYLFDGTIAVELHKPWEICK